jgi:hypothetical protein
MVEAAIVTPVVVAMLFGIIEFGMLFKDYLATQAMLRAGVRVASASPRTASFAQDTADKVQETASALNPAAVEELWVYKPTSSCRRLTHGPGVSRTPAPPPPEVHPTVSACTSRSGTTR